MKYEWKPVKGFEGMYEVSNSGIIRGIDRIRPDYRGKGAKIKGKIISTPLDRYGYQKVVFTKKGKRTYTTVHRVVASVFLPNPDNLPQVNHKDGDKTNNHVDNLEWCNQFQNMKHASKMGLTNALSGEDHHNTIISNETAKEILIKFKNGATNTEIMKEYNLGRSSVSRLKVRKTFKNIKI